MPPAQQNARLQPYVAPFVRALPVDLLQNLACSFMPGLWSNVTAEGHPVSQVVASLTGLPPGDELDSLVTKVLFTDMKNYCLTQAWMASGLNGVRTLVRCPDAEILGEMHRNHQPAIFVFSHFGPRYAIAPAFQSVGIPVGLFQGLIPPPLQRKDVEQFVAQLPGMEVFWINDPKTIRAIHLKRAVERVQRGEMVAMAIDGGHGDVLADAEFFGHRIQVARGPAVLARLTGAPLIPITVTWDEGWSIEFRVHAPIVRPDVAPTGSGEFDLALTDRAVRFFDEFLRKAPEQMRLDRIARLVSKPKVS